MTSGEYDIDYSLPIISKAKTDNNDYGDFSIQKSLSDDDGSHLMAQQQEEEKILLDTVMDMDKTNKGIKDLNLSFLRGMQLPEESNNLKGPNTSVHCIGSLRNVRNPANETKINVKPKGLSKVEKPGEQDEQEDLMALAELVPGLKTGKIGAAAITSTENSNANDKGRTPNVLVDPKHSFNSDSAIENSYGAGEIDDEIENGRLGAVKLFQKSTTVNKHVSMIVKAGSDSQDSSSSSSSSSLQDKGESDNGAIMTEEHNAALLRVQQAVANDDESSSNSTAGHTASSGGHDDDPGVPDVRQYADKAYTGQNYDPLYDSPDTQGRERKVESRAIGEDTQNQAKYRDVANSSNSISTATHGTHQQVCMPMYLKTFKPATGCTNASDFIVRCFVARLRSGITVVKHGRSRWCKSRLRILHVHSDGRSLSWKPALGEPSSSKRPPKLDLRTCIEVRHAWSPDPLNPMFTGTPMLRRKCEASSAHKSFALIFSRRTVDITAVTADQCKVLMEGFSALCFRLQVAHLAGQGKKVGISKEDERRSLEGDVKIANKTMMTSRSNSVNELAVGSNRKNNNNS